MRLQKKLGDAIFPCGFVKALVFKRVLVVFPYTLLRVRSREKNYFSLGVLASRQSPAKLSVTGVFVDTRGRNGFCPRYEYAVRIFARSFRFVNPKKDVLPGGKERTYAL